MSGQTSNAQLIIPDWPIPRRVKSISTTRVGGFSDPPFDSFNLGIRAGDDPAIAQKNRELLCEQAGLPADPCWLWQVHSTRVVDAATTITETQADASWTDRSGFVCVALAADCLPVLFADRQGRCVAAAHAGWRGLLNGVLEAVIDTLPVASGELMAWLGPAIGPTAFEVGQEVHDAFLQVNAEFAGSFTAGKTPGKWMADLPQLARSRLRNAGVTDIFGGDRCTYSEPEAFYSYRRDGQRSGRMASLIWLE